MNTIKSFVLYVMTIIVSILFGVLGYEWFIRKNGAKRSEAEKAVYYHEKRFHHYAPYRYSPYKSYRYSDDDKEEDM